MQKLIKRIRERIFGAEPSRLRREARCDLCDHQPLGKRSRNPHEIGAGTPLYVLDNFFTGGITDMALVNSLSALKLGKQYVATTEKACAAVRVEKELPISMMERRFLQDESEANRQKGITLANDICKNYRREGKFYDEILDKAK